MEDAKYHSGTLKNRLQVERDIRTQLTHTQEEVLSALTEGQAKS